MYDIILDNIQKKKNETLENNLVNFIELDEKYSGDFSKIILFKVATPSTHIPMCIEIKIYSTLYLCTLMIFIRFAIFRIKFFRKLFFTLYMIHKIKLLIYNLLIYNYLV